MSQNRVPALDGLRGVAVLLVLLSHSFNGMGSVEIPLASWTPGLLPGGGFAGVQLFFALSGYLITGILLSELERTRTVAIRAFWWRRVKRLYPALAVTCLALLAYSWLDLEVRPQDAAADVLGALTYTTNLLAATPGHGGYLGHTWSLAVEEQFYVAWPLLTILAFQIGGRRSVGGLALALAGSVIAARFIWAFDPSAYWRLLRWDAVLLGCALAAFPIRAGALTMAGATAVLAYYAATPVRYEPLPFALASTACVVMVAGAGGIPILTSAPLRNFGRVSYGLYLWSCLLMRFPLPGWLALVLSLVAAETSYRYIERPIMNRGRHSLRPCTPERGDPCR